MLTALPMPDAGLVAAVLVAAGVTALVALGMVLARVARRSGVTVRAVLSTVSAGAAVIAAVVVGVTFASPQSAAAETEPGAPVYVVSDQADGQLPALDAAE